MKPVTTLIPRRPARSAVVIAPRVSWRVRCRVRRHRWRIDRALADCRPAGPAEDRAWRARQLASDINRRRVAGSLRRVIADAQEPRAGLVTAAAPVCRTAVLSCREGLLGLAERLESPEPVGAAGVARTLMVLCDPSGPLYQHGSERSLSETIWWIADGLTPSRPPR